VAFGAGLVAFIDFIEVFEAFEAFELIDLVVIFEAVFALAGALVAAGFTSDVFWRRGFLVAFGAGFVLFIDVDFIDDDFIVEVFIVDLAGLVAFIVLLAAVFGAGEAFGAAAIAGAVMRNAAARSDARVFFISVHLLPEQHTGTAALSREPCASFRYGVAT
jgi:hypothetical protein